MTEEAAAVSVAAAAAVEAAVAVSVAVQERCIKQPAQTAKRKLKYPSFHPVTDRYIAGNATRNINQQDTNSRLLICSQ